MRLDVARHGKVFEECGGDLQVDAVGAQLRARRASGRLRARHREIARTRLGAGGEPEAQALGREREAVVLRGVGRASRDRRELERQRVGGELHVGVAHVQVGDDLAQAVRREAHPDAQVAGAAAQRLGHRQVRAEATEVGVERVDEYLARGLPVRGLAAQAHVGAQLQAARELARRRRGEDRAMASEMLAHLDLDAVEAHLGDVGLLVAPDEHRFVDAQARLREQPLGERALARPRLVERLVGEVDEAVGAAAQVQLRMVEVDVPEAELPRQQRPPRDRHLGALEGKGGLAVAVRDGEALERHARPQALPRAGDAARRDLHARGLLDGGDDVVAIAVDVGERHIAHPKQGHGEGDEEDSRDARSQAKDGTR